jgi:hypothetical protein
MNGDKAETQVTSGWPWRAEVGPHTKDQIERLSVRYSSSFAEIRKDIEELVSIGRMMRAKELSEATGQHFNDNELPLFFTGNLDSSLVLIHLNPKQSNNFGPKESLCAGSGPFSARGRAGQPWLKTRAS